MELGLDGADVGRRGWAEDDLLEELKAACPCGLVSGESPVLGCLGRGC